MNRTFAALGDWAVKNWPRMIILLVASMVIGIATDRLVGGKPALYGGGFQALVLIITLFYVLVLFLFQPYGPRATSILEMWPLKVLRIITFIIASIVTTTMLVEGVLIFDPNGPDISTKTAKSANTEIHDAK